MSLIRANRRRGATATIAALGAVALGAALSPSAQAAFTSNKCLGDAVTGSGATFQDNAHNNFWRSPLNSGAIGSFCADAGSTPSITYNATAGRNGSGLGRRVMGERSGDNATGTNSRNQPERFAGTDEPPSTTGVAQMNNGTDATGDEAKVRVIPAAVGAIAVIVNLPDACDTATVAPAQLSEPTDPNRRRVKLTGGELDQVFASDDGRDTWGELFPGVTAGANCADKPIIRVRRLDDSGSTFVFKDYLSKQNAGRGWLTDFVSPDTRTWPNPTKQINGVSTLQASADTGGGALRTYTNATDGSISYVELGSARGGSGVFEREANAADSTYFVQITNGSGEFLDPSSNADGFVKSTPANKKGAGCINAQFSGVPAGDDPTFGDWSKASGVNAAAAGVYGICTLTYLLAFDDNAAAYGASTAEERKARTVFDYMTAILAESAQGTTPGSGLLAQDQAPLPATLRSRIAADVSEISFNKAGSGSTPPPPTTPTPTGPTPAPTTPVGPGVTPPGIPPVVRPSNVFTIPSARVSGTSIVLSVQVPGAGTLQGLATARYKGKTIRAGQVTATASRGGAVRLTIRMSSRYRTALRRAKRLRTSLRITFTPVGGTANAGTRTLTVKAKKAAKKKKKSSRN